MYWLKRTEYLLFLSSCAWISCSGRGVPSYNQTPDRRPHIRIQRHSVRIRTHRSVLHVTQHCSQLLTCLEDDETWCWHMYHCHFCLMPGCCISRSYEGLAECCQYIKSYSKLQKMFKKRLHLHCKHS